MTNIETLVLQAISELRGIDHWLDWRYELDAAGKRTKVPYRADGQGKASSTDPNSWAQYDHANAARILGKFNGVGFVVTGTGKTGIDLDHCRDAETGVIEPWAMNIIERFNSYTEITPSKQGVRVWINGKVPEGGNRKGNVEIYDTGRYFTVTENHLEGTPVTIENRQEELNKFHVELFPQKASLNNVEAGGNGHNNINLKDTEIIYKARHAKNGQVFEKLWNGDKSDYGDDDSRADLALCCILAFWTNKDPAAIDRLFRQSGCVREKWDRDDYRERTIQTAIENTNQTYNCENNNNHSSNILNKNNILSGTNLPRDDSFKSGQSGGQSVDNSRIKGELSEPFDQFLKENPEPHYKREVAEIIGTTYKDPTFIKLVQRRKHDGVIRVLHGGEKIQWINKEWQRSVVQLDSTAIAFTNLRLPFGAEKYIAVPEHSQMVVAGDIGSGKTHWGYLLADLNAEKMPIRHFFNEIGASKAKRNLEDFPNLTRYYGRNYFLVDLDKESIDVPENLDPNGLNIYDYLHLSASAEWFLILQQELTRLSQRLEKGVICVMLQKKQGVKQAMGGDVTRMQCEVYLTLNIDQNQDNFKECRVDIEKAKDWVTNTNPETLCCKYKTTPRWGKLEPIGEWERKQTE